VQLQGARDEGIAVAALLGTKCHTDAEATDTLVREARSPFVLHLATHGFALPDRRPGGLSWIGTDGLRGLSLLASMNDPDRRAGLAFAGAADWTAHGKTLPGPGDGLLLAADVTNLNLTGTAMVVLSACQTGVGQVAAGDATWSLARAFQKAGARVVVMSLWRVPDQSTRLLMEDFYRAFLKDHAPAQALRHAQMAAMSAGMAPRHWAAFTCWGSAALMPGAGNCGSRPQQARPV
jgi:CHAT domain-containing protein